MIDDRDLLQLSISLGFGDFKSQTEKSEVRFFQELNLLAYLYPN
jgi:hypothetical protein